MYKAVESHRKPLHLTVGYPFILGQVGVGIEFDR